MSDPIISELMQLERTDARRMQIQGYRYIPRGGWSSSALSSAYKKRWQELNAAPPKQAEGTEAFGELRSASVAEMVSKPKPKKAKTGKLTTDDLSEVGVGAAFHSAHSAELIAVQEWKCWASFQPASGLWTSTTAKQVTALLADWFKDGLFEKAKKNDKLAREARRFRNMTACRNAQDYAFGKAQVSSAIFDADPNVLLTADGAIDLRRAELRAARADDFFTRAAGAGYEAGYTDPLWDEVLSALPAGVADYLQIVIGNALTGHTLNKSMVFFFSGDGSNGKSTLTDVLKKMLGSYADRVDSSLLLNAGDGNLFGKAKLKALRAAFIEELPKANWLDALIIKELAETSEMTAAKKFQDEETFDFTATVFVNTNYLPQVSENDRGTWRRLAPVPMPYTFVDAEEYDATAEPEAMGLRKKNPALANAEKNPSVLKAALVWAVEGARKWYDAGMVEPPMPAAMEAAKREWRGGQDKIELWWSERVVADPNSYCLIGDLHDTYEDEMAEIGRAPEKVRKFTEMLQAHPLFKGAGAEYVRRQRAPRNLLRSAHIPDNSSRKAWEAERSVRPSTGMLNFVSGVRFRTEADDMADESAPIPDNASALVD